MKQTKKLGGVVLSVVTAALMLAVLAACKNTADDGSRGGSFGGQSGPDNVRYERGGHEDVRGLPVDTRVYKAGDIVPLPTVEPELDGHVFIGWGALVGTQLTLIDENNTEHDLASNHHFKSGVSYSDRVIGNIKAFKMPELRDWQIYLGLTPNFDEAHSITYELNGGSNAAGAKDKYGYSEEFPLPVPTKKRLHIPGLVH